MHVKVATASVTNLMFGKTSGVCRRPFGPYQRALNSGRFADAQNSETLLPAFRETDWATRYNNGRPVDSTMGNLTFSAYVHRPMTVREPKAEKRAP